MACTAILRNTIEGEQAAGTWKYNGFILLSSYDGNRDNIAQFGSGGGGGSYTFPSPGGAISGESPTIPFSGATAGVYSFSYTCGSVPCEKSSNVAVVVQPPPCSGKTKTVYLCTNQPSYDVKAALTEDMDACSPLDEGIWVTNAPNFNYASGVIQPLTAGDFTTTYISSVTPSTLAIPGATVICSNCQTEASIRTIISSNTSTQRVKCTYWVDMSPHSLNQAALDTFKISSFIFNGVEYVSSPVGFGTKNTITFGDATNYLTNVVDALESINVPYMKYEYSDEAECNPYNPSGQWKYFTIDWRATDYFQIVIQKSGVNFMRFTQTKSEMWQGGQWVLAQNSVAGTFYACGQTRINCESYLGC